MIGIRTVNGWLISRSLAIHLRVTGKSVEEMGIFFLLVMLRVDFSSKDQRGAEGKEAKCADKVMTLLLEELS